MTNATTYQTPAHEATISISKIITVATDTMVYRIKSSQFTDEIAKHNSIHVKGWFNAAKYHRYAAMIHAAGFNVAETWGIDTHNDGSIEFSIFYAK